MDIVHRETNFVVWAWDSTVDWSTSSGFWPIWGKVLRAHCLRFELLFLSVRSNVVDSNKDGYNSFSYWWWWFSSFWNLFTVKFVSFHFNLNIGLIFVLWLNLAFTDFCVVQIHHAHPSCCCWAISFQSIDGQVLDGVAVYGGDAFFFFLGHSKTFELKRSCPKGPKWSGQVSEGTRPCAYLCTGTLSLSLWRMRCWDRVIF